MQFKSVIIDVIDGYTTEEPLGIRSLHFFQDDTLLTFDYWEDDYYDEGGCAYWNGFDTGLIFDTENTTLTGEQQENGWQGCEDGGGERIYFVFATLQDFNKAAINNFHSAGYFTENGAKNVNIWITTTNFEPDDWDTYDYGITPPDSTLIFEGELNKHSETDGEDSQIIYEDGGVLFETIINHTALINIITTFPRNIWKADNENQMTISYRMTLTGAENGLPDIIIPIKSLRGVLQADYVYYCDIQIAGVEYETQIRNRKNGTILLDIIYTSPQKHINAALLFAMPLTTIQVQNGIFNSTISLHGRQLRAIATSKILINMDKAISYNTDSNSYKTLKCPIQKFIEIGDLINFRGDTFPANYICYTIAPNMEYMIIRERA